MKIRVIATTHFDRQFNRVSEKRPQIKSLLVNAIQLLKEDEFQSKSLRIHKLKGNLKDCYAFSLTYDLRVIFQKRGNLIILANIGSHDEIY